MVEGEDPRTMMLELEESKGEGKKGRQKSFYCIQEHDPKSVGNYNNPEENTICTKGDMIVVDHKGYKKYYNLTHQTCSGKVMIVFSKWVNIINVKIGAAFHASIFFIAICVQYVKDSRGKKM